MMVTKLGITFSSRGPYFQVPAVSFRGGVLETIMFRFQQLGFHVRWVAGFGNFQRMDFRKMLGFLKYISFSNIRRHFGCLFVKFHWGMSWIPDTHEN